MTSSIHNIVRCCVTVVVVIVGFQYDSSTKYSCCHGLNIPSSTSNKRQQYYYYRNYPIMQQKTVSAIPPKSIIVSKGTQTRCYFTVAALSQHHHPISKTYSYFKDTTKRMSNTSVRQNSNDHSTTIHVRHNDHLLHQRSLNKKKQLSTTTTTTRTTSIVAKLQTLLSKHRHRRNSKIHLLQQQHSKQNLKSVSTTSTKTTNNSPFTEGGFYGMTSLLVTTYMAILFLYPTETTVTNQFSPQELSWAASNGYIVTMISHYLRRQERIRIFQLWNHTPTVISKIGKRTCTSSSSASSSSTRMINNSDCMNNNNNNNNNSVEKGNSCNTCIDSKDMIRKVNVDSTNKKTKNSIEQQQSTSKRRSDKDTNFLLEVLKTFQVTPIVRRSAINKKSIHNHHHQLPKRLH